MRMQHHGTVCAKIVQKEGDMEEQDDEDAEDPDEEEEDKDNGSTHATVVADLAVRDDEAQGRTRSPQV